MKRVMIVTNSLTGGGAERSMNLVSNELTRRGWLIALVPINSSEPDLVIPGCEVFLLDRKWQGSALGTLSAFLKFSKVVRTWKPDLVVVNCDLPELFGALLPGKHKIVVVEHTNPAWSTRMSFGKVVRRILRFRRSIWVAVSSHLKIWPNGYSPSAVLPNPFIPSVDEIRSKGGGSFLKRLTYIGRLSAEKRPEKILEIGVQSFAEIQIIGDGVMRNSLQNEVIASNLKVTFSGHVRDPWALIEPGDLLIIPSAWEGDGLVVVEGIERAVPMLMSDIPDLRRFGFPEKNYCKDVGDFVARINLYCEDLESLIIPEDIKNMILASRSPKVVGDSWEGFLNSI